MSEPFGSVRRAVSGLPLPLRYALIGGVACGGVGGLAGLVIGLWAYAPTAWFAILEVGVPAAYVGAMLGLIFGGVAHLVGKRPAG